jgi:hypothetical protein
VIPHRLKGCQKITIELTLTGRGVAITQNGEKDMAEKWEKISFFPKKRQKNTGYETRSQCIILKRDQTQFYSMSQRIFSLPVSPPLLSYFS